MFCNTLSLPMVKVYSIFIPPVAFFALFLWGRGSHSCRDEPTNTPRTWLNVNVTPTLALSVACLDSCCWEPCCIPFPPWFCGGALEAWLGLVFHRNRCHPNCPQPAVREGWNYAETMRPLWQHQAHVYALTVQAHIDTGIQAQCCNALTEN